ncbi:MAG: leucine-rich repeat domain-containing protein [Planctomycetaceae bacterium]|nr:leucine-rich repeat domain-containing protein [Planctomycetales bacterium]MCB9873030.1 leucine-rich repeat domain-containing protein [Planctomycetaceae bacterium]MCB9937023.1 leucine-rich repeat domain-containing protein [Planctomycetaceae bacterium]
MRWSIVCTVLSISMLSLVSDLTAQQSIFPDKALEAVVRNYVFEKRNNDQPIVEDDVVNISTIKGHNKGIKDLTGLEKCRSLALLDLAGNEVTKIDAIAGLKNIQSLDLSKNKITDISPIAGLTKLQYLQLSDNQITDLSAVSRLENLRSLYISNNKIQNLAPVASLKKMWSLYADGNQIADLGPLASTDKLDSLDIRGNQVADLSPLRGRESWKFLFLDNNKVTDISVLVQTAKAANAKPDRSASFWQVFLAGNPLSDAAKTQQLAELKNQTKVVDF